MKKFLAAVAAVALFAAPALAGTMENTFNNTVKVKSAEGAESSWYFNADGTFTMKAKTPEGQDVEIKGTWAKEGDKICSTPNAVEGQPAPVKTCVNYVEGKNVGDSWEVTSDTGAKSTVTIVAGR